MLSSSYNKYDFWRNNMYIHYVVTVSYRDIAETVSDIYTAVRTASAVSGWGPKAVKKARFERQ